MLDIPATTVPFLAAYAETHFRFFPHFPNLLFKKEPEIIFDLPRRLDPGQNLPIVLLLNEIHRFTIEPLTVAITISRKAQKPILFNFNDLEKYEISHSLDKQLRVFIFTITREELADGEVFINAALTFKKGRRIETILNDNLFSSSKLPFSCFISPNHLPCNELCLYGDLHVHSMYSQSHVEFGPPLGVIDRIASSSGLSFAGITDHSYDLACSISNYLKQDQSLTRWNALKNELNEKFKTVLIHGEEISCLNNDRKAVHLCALGLNDYISGTIDGGRRNNNRAFKQLTISQAVDEVHRQGGICFAAHPGSRAGILQQIFLHRGTWSLKDAEASLDAFQALNSGYNGSWDRGKAMWIKMLQSGRRIPLLAGNDAHGDFNRYRAISAPFLSIYENSQRFMGCSKVGVYNTLRDASAIFNSIKNGSTFITTGPYISINYDLSPTSHAVSSRSIASTLKRLYLHAESTPEFGQLISLRVLTGSQGSVNERVIFTKSCKAGTYEINEEFSIEDLCSPAYIRAEVKSSKGEEVFQGYTSPCYL